jgi:hypothetical protein
MIRLDSNSSSEILRATQIGLIALHGVSASEWKTTGRVQQREVILNGSIVEFFKGFLQTGADAAVTLQVRQYQPAGPRFFVVPGVWSGYELEPGTSFVLFSVSPENTTEMFAEPSLLSVELAGTAVPDIRLALRAGSPELSIASLIARCGEEMPAWGFLFARYLDARLPEAFFSRFPDFDAVMRAVEDPRLSAVATRMLLSAAYTKLMVYDPAPSAFLNRLLAATQRLLQTPRGEPLRTEVLETFLPNLLGITGGLTRKSASDVLANDRPQFEQFLRESKMEAILAWVSS